MEFFRIWIVPPLVGGIIGLFTNWLAIKMLFRPLRELRFLGLRLPFTPGILPRERLRLADSVGETISRELLTPDALKERFQDPQLQSRLEASIDNILAQFLAQDSGAFFVGAGPAAAASPQPAGPDIVQEILRRAFTSLASTEAFRTALAASLREAVTRLFDLRIGDIIGPEAARDLAQELVGKAAAPDAEAFVSTMVDSWYASGKPVQSGQSVLEEQQGCGLAPLVPVEAVVPLLDLAARSLYKASLPVLDDFMADPALRKALEQQAAALVKRAVGRLNSIQRLIVNVAGYEESIAKAMPDTIADLTQAISSLLRDPAMPDKLSEALQKRFRASRAAADAGAENGRAETDRAAKRLMDIVERESLKMALLASMRGLAAQGAQSVDAAGKRVEFFAYKRLGECAAGAEDLVRDLADRAALQISRSLAKGKEGMAFFAGLTTMFREELGHGLAGTRLEDALGLGTARPDGLRLRSALAQSLTDRSMDLLSGQAAKIVGALDIRAMVVDKINSLDMLDVERLILKVVDKELYWITILGGILGIFIGIIQSIIYLL